MPQASYQVSIYNLQTNLVNTPTETCHRETDLGVTFEPDDWDDIWATTNFSVQNIVTMETNYKYCLAGTWSPQVFLNLSPITRWSVSEAAEAQVHNCISGVLPDSTTTLN